MDKIKKIIIYTLCILIFLFLSWILVLYEGWPLWSMLAIAGAALGIGLLYVFCRRVWVAIHQRSQISKESKSKTQEAEKNSPKTKLKNKWSQAIQALRSSSLKRNGDAVRSLPWFMVVGHSGDGKTTALTHSKLSLPVSNKAKIPGSQSVVQTLNCDWWFFEKSVVMDCAGRYVSADGDASDSDEWDLNLDLLAKNRRAEGLNGLVLVISVERLLNPRLDELEKEALFLRGRIEQLIRLFSKRYPIYVTLTKCDLIYGFESWIHNLPEQQLKHAMGYSLTEDMSEDIDNDDIDNFVDRAFDSIFERLQVYRNQLLESQSSSEDTMPFLLLPREMDVLRLPLKHFLRTALGKNPYLESPFLRGLYFSSAIQKGGAVSKILPEAHIPVREEAAGQGVFLRDIFGVILPGDKNLNLPTSMKNGWKTLTQNLGLVGWFLLMTSLAVILTISFIRNVDTINQLHENYPVNLKPKGNIQHDVDYLTKAMISIKELEHRNSMHLSKWMADFGLIDNLEDQLKNNFQELYQRYILATTEKNFYLHVDQVLNGGDMQNLPQLILSQLRYTNLLQARIKGADYEALSKLPRIPFDATQSDDSTSIALHEKMVDLFLAHLAWTPSDSPFLQERLRNERATLIRLSEKTAAFEWIPPLVNTQYIEILPVLLQDFWQPGYKNYKKDNSPLEEVPAIYTSQGFQKISMILDEYEQAVLDGPKFMEDKKRFLDWYTNQRLQSWRTFIAHFSEGQNFLKNEASWRNTLGVITELQSPYFQLLEKINRELSDLAEGERPNWLNLANHLWSLRQEEARSRSHGETSQWLGAVHQSGGTALRQAVQGDYVQGVKTVTGQLEETQDLRQYLKDVNEAALQAAGGPGSAYQAAVDFYAFGVDPSAETESPLTKASKAFDKLRSTRPPVTPDQDDIWRIVAGPMHFTLSYINRQASCSVQADWESQVMWPLQTLGGQDEAVETLFGVDGSVWAFADGVAKPFLQRDANSFRLRTALGAQFPLSSEFMWTLNTAIGKKIDQLIDQQNEALRKQELAEKMQELERLRQEKLLDLNNQKSAVEVQMTEMKNSIADFDKKEWALQITAQPTGINREALAQPYQTLLTAQCKQGLLQLNNLNFPMTADWLWSRSSCSDMQLQIKVGQLTLVKKFQGADGMLQFLSDYRDGSQTYTPADFPQQRTQLQALKISQIKTQFEIANSEALVSAYEAMVSWQGELLQAAQALKALQEAIAKTELERMQPHAEAVEKRVAKRQPASQVLDQIALPKQIGICWNADDRPNASAQTLNQLFKSMTTHGQ